MTKKTRHFQYDEKFISLYEAIPMGIIVVDKTGIIVFINSYTEQLFQYKQEELVDQSIEILVPLRHNNSHSQLRETFLKQPQTKMMGIGRDVYGQRKDGSEIPLEIGLNTLNIDEETLVLASIVDITKQKERDEILRKSEETFRAIVENVPAMINSFDENGQPLIWNKALAESTGYSLEDCKTTPVLEKCYPGQSQALSRILNFEDKKGEFHEYHPVSKDGKPLVHLWAAFDLPNGRTTWIGRDITSQKKIEEQLRQSQKMEALGTLSGGIAHEFNNMLLPMLGRTEMLMNMLPEDGKEQHHLQQIQIAGKRAAELVRQIMTFGRMEITVFKVLDMTSVVQRALSLARSTMPSNIEFQQRLQGDCDPVRGDTTQIHQVILNLCNNAYHAMEDSGGIIEVTLEQLKTCPRDLNMGQGECLRLKLRDTGQGIPPEDQKLIFDPFFTTKEIGKGTGLGLSVVHGIVMNHQGRITVESTEGKGTTFSVFFPVTEGKADKEESIPIPISSKEIGHILLVEDEPSIITLYQEYLEESGYKVTACTNGKDALDLFNKNPSHFDVVFTDQSMPKMTGKQLSQELLKIKASIPIILSTGYSSMINEEEVKEVGVRYYLEKPIELGKLKLIIQECLKNPTPGP